ncbi:MAG: YebC/PmpR family DNA-binding transcriptional regulator [Patescibacteria group bacterium]
MSGHSKWSTIKHKKGITDAKRGKLFSQLAKNIRIATKEGGSGDPKINSSLRLAIDKARAANMPKENLQRAIDRGMGKGKGGQIQEILYEGFGPGGVAMLIVSLTDNKQRTSAEIKNILSKAGGSLGSPGSASYMFKREKDFNYTVIIPTVVDDESLQKKLEELMDKLRENEDVEDVYCTANL